MAARNVIQGAREREARKAALVLLIAASCNSKASNYYPLAKGNIWNYLITIVTQSHGIVDATITRTDTTSTTVLTDTTIDGKAAWKLQNTANWVEFIVLCRVGEDPVLHDAVISRRDDHGNDNQ